MPFEGPFGDGPTREFRERVYAPVKGGCVPTDEPLHAHANMTDDEIEDLRRKCRNAKEPEGRTWKNDHRRKAVLELFRAGLVSTKEARLMLSIKGEES